MTDSTIALDVASGSPSWLADARQRGSFRRAVRRWYARHRRDLPWRRHRSLYRVWVSEIMLQQTQAATVVPYYQRFLKSFPSVRRLALADEEHVLRAWEGLGYYRRARNLHQAAKLVVRDLQGRIPRTREQLQALPGIGRYTAAAILSFALDQPHAILEANTRRLYRRLLAASSEAGSDRSLWAFAETLLPRVRIADWNDALIDLGATLCSPRQPQCSRCPLTRWCGAFTSGDAESFGTAKPATETTPLEELAIIVESGGKVLLRERREGEWWSGLWDFPRVRLSDAESAADVDRLRSRFFQETGIEIDTAVSLPTLRHSVTRYRIRLQCLRAEVDNSTADRLRNGYRWIDREQLERLPLTATARKMAGWLSTGGVD